MASGASLLGLVSGVSKARAIAEPAAPPHCVDCGGLDHLRLTPALLPTWVRLCPACLAALRGTDQPADPHA